MIWTLVGIAVGVALGWIVRSSMGSTRTRVLEELYSRKLRHAEQLRDEAIKTLNANKVEMAGFAERFAALDAEIQELGGARTRSEDARHALELALVGREEELAHWRETAAQEVRTCAEARQRMEAAEQLSTQAAAAMDQAYDEVFGLTARATGAEQLLAAAGARADELEQRLAAGDAELARARDAALEQDRELALAREVILQRDLELEPLRVDAAELEPLRRELFARGAELARRAEHSAAQLARLEVLEPFAVRLPELTLERDALVERQRELERELAEHQLVRERELERAAATERDLDSLRAAHAELDASSRARLQELDVHSRATVQELEAQGRAQVQELEAQARANVQELEARWRASLQEHELHARKAAQELEGRCRATEQELARERARFAKTQASLQSLETEARESQRESARLAKELRSAQVELEARQRDGARKDGKLAGLEAALLERNERIKALTPVLRSAAARGLLRPQPPKKPVKSLPADDLKRIAGIGPVLAKKLRRLGVASFDQLAELTRTELDALADKLGIAADRIRREGWITSARVEARARDGG